MMLSHGTPMLLAGDEFGHTQRGNNNAYAQDNDISWLDWQAIGDEGRGLRTFLRRLIATRRAFPILHRPRFLVGTYNEKLDVKDVTWLSPNGDEMKPEQWDDGNARCLGVVLDGRAQPTGIRRRGSDATLLIVYNSYHDVVKFTLPEVAEGVTWVTLIDTNQPTAQLASFPFGHVYEVTGRSVLAFALASSQRDSDRVRRSIGSILEITDAPPI
jgi:isoamylase